MLDVPVEGSSSPEGVCATKNGGVPSSYDTPGEVMRSAQMEIRSFEA